MYYFEWDEKIIIIGNELFLMWWRGITIGFCINVNGDEYQWLWVNINYADCITHSKGEHHYHGNCIIMYYVQGYT